MSVVLYGCDKNFWLPAESLLGGDQCFSAHEGLSPGFLLLPLYLVPRGPSALSPVGVGTSLMTSLWHNPYFGLKGTLAFISWTSFEFPVPSDTSCHLFLKLSRGTRHFLDLLPPCTTSPTPHHTHTPLHPCPTDFPESESLTFGASFEFTLHSGLPRSRSQVSGSTNVAHSFLSRGDYGCKILLLSSF